MFLAHCYLQHREEEVCEGVKESGDTPSNNTQRQFLDRLRCWGTALIWLELFLEIDTILLLVWVQQYQ